MCSQRGDWLFVLQGKVSSSGTEQKFADSSFSVLQDFVKVKNPFGIIWNLESIYFSPSYFLFSSPSSFCPIFPAEKKSSFISRGTVLQKELGINLVAEIKNGKVL